MIARPRAAARHPQAVHDRAPAWGLVAAGAVALPVVVGAGYATAASLGVAGAASGHPSLDHLRRVIEDRDVWRGLAWTLYAASASTVLAAVAAIGIALAYRGPRLGAQVARASALVSFPMPYVVAASVALLFLGQSGVIARVAEHVGLIDAPNAMPALVLDRAGVGFILMFAWKETAFLLLVAGSILASHGHALEDAARTLGASPGATMRRVTLPVLWRGLAPAIVLVLVFVAGSYEGAVLLAPSDPLPYAVATYERYISIDLTRRGEAFVLTVIGLVLTTVAVIVFEAVRSRWEWSAP